MEHAPPDATPTHASVPNDSCQPGSARRSQKEPKRARQYYDYYYFYYFLFMWPSGSRLVQTPGFVLRATRAGISPLRASTDPSHAPSRKKIKVKYGRFPVLGICEPPEKIHVYMTAKRT